MKQFAVVLFIFSWMDSCITPYELTIPFQEQLVVEGLITDQPGPYQVKISKTVPIKSQLDLTNWVGGATVTIEDDLGNSEVLVEKTTGNYYTATFQGVVGRSYWVKIYTGEGNSYRSTPEKLIPVGDFDLRFEFVQNEEAKYRSEQIHSTNGFAVYLDSKVLPEQSGLVWWRWTGTFEILTYPEARTKPIPEFLGGGDAPDPLPCSGYIAIDRKLIRVGPCTCCDCWVTQYNTVPLISDPKFINENKIANQKIAFVEANLRTFYNKYHLEVEQLSLSPAIYNFWKIIKSQEQIASTLFQTPPPKTGTNIISTSAGATPVLGYFAAAAVKRHSISIRQKDVPYRIYEDSLSTISCTELYKNSSTKKPTFW